MQRRQCLALAASWVGALAAPRWAAAAATGQSPINPRLAAAWQLDSGYQVGILQSPAGGQQALTIRSAIDLPTRAHGLLLEPGGTLLAVAKRPGDWLLRWHPDGKALAWSWVEPGRTLNGHVIHSADGRTLYTTETDLDTGDGLIGLRDAASLEKIGEWPTHGRDPHELLLDADGSLLVANGGILVQPETGRLKTQLMRMDPSLVRIDTRSGALRGQWRLTDPRLSIRHLAWGARAVAAPSASPRLLGIALQAEHDDAATKAAAPVLAVFDGQTLQPWATGTAAQIGPSTPSTPFTPSTPSTPSLAGYGGDIAAVAGGFAVSCPRANGVALWQADGQWGGFVPLPDACALANDTAAAPGLLAGGSLNALRRDAAGAVVASRLPGLQLDNHWLQLDNRWLGLGSSKVKRGRQG